MPLFWLSALLFCMVTGFVAGLYPALHLSSFVPVKVLKGTFKMGKLAALSRKVLVVTQFTVSIALIAGTMIVYRQIQFGRNRPVGYDREGLITVDMNPEIERHFREIRQELKNSGTIVEMGESVNTTTAFNTGDVNFDWVGRDKSRSVGFAISNVSYEYGATIGWQLVEGRDFSRDYPTDSSAFILNESAVRVTGFAHPVGETITWNGKRYHIIGVIRNIVFESPYQIVSPSIFHLSGGQNRAVTIRIFPPWRSCCSGTSYGW